MASLASKLNPFRGLPNPREVWAWGMYDLANQSFTLLIITLLFSLYVKDVASPAPAFSPAELAIVAQVDAGELSRDAPEAIDLLERQDEAERAGAWNWSLMHGGSLLIVVLLSPLAGALADSRGWRKRALLVTGVGCSLLTMALAGVGPGMVLLAALLYIPANICYQIGENMLASFLPQISTSRTIGRVSGIGWSMGYVGALLLLLLVAGIILLAGLDRTEDWRPFFVLAGVWFLIGILPIIPLLREDPPDTLPPGQAKPSIVRDAIDRVRDTVKHASRYRELVRFLIAFFVYGLGVQTIIGFASIIAAGFGIRDMMLVVFVLQLTITAGLAAALTGRFQDAIGAKTTVIVYLGIWILSCGGLIYLTYTPDAPQAAFWIIGNGLGIGLGGIGTASRSLVGRFAPRHRTAEFFGLWGMAYKLAGAVGVLSFGAVTRLLGPEAAVILLTGFFVGGLVLVLPVSESRGYRAARKAEKLHQQRSTASGSESGPAPVA